MLQCAQANLTQFWQIRQQQKRNFVAEFTILYLQNLNIAEIFREGLNIFHIKFYRFLFAIQELEASEIQTEFLAAEDTAVIYADIVELQLGHFGWEIRENAGSLNTVGAD